MPTPDDWTREVDESLFGNGASDAPPPRHEPDTEPPPTEPAPTEPPPSS
jgi:hypothetical protein